jgi:Bacterial membrane protein YfhO
MALRSAARRWAPAAVPFVLAVVLFAPATVGGKVLSASDIPLFSAPYPPPPAGAQPRNPLQFDAAYTFEPDGLFVRNALRHARLPVWTPNLSAGRPLLAAQQSAPLFPLTWIGVVFPYWESLAWIAVLKLTLAALGTFLLSRALGLRRGPALLGGVAFAFGTYLILWLGHPHSNAYVVLPWLFLLAERLCRRGTVGDAGALGGALGLAWLGGQPESALIVSLATAAWVLHRLVSTVPTRPEAVRRGALALGAGLLGLALAAVMLLPFAEILHQSFATSRAQAPLAPKAFLTVFFPKYWPTGGPGNYAERTLYVGALPTLLAAAGLVARRPRGAQLFFAGLAVVALAIALDTGPVSRTIRHLPILDKANLIRVLILASLALAMLAAYGCERLLAGSPDERRRMLVAAGAVAVVPALIVLGGHAGWLGDLRDGVKRALGLTTPATAAVFGLAAVLRWLGFALAALVLLAAVMRWRRHRAVLVAAAIGLTALDLVAAGGHYNPAIPKAEAAPPTPPAVTAMRRLTARGGRVIGVDAMHPNTASRWGLQDATGNGENPWVGRFERLWLVLGGVAQGSATAVAGADPRTPKLLDIFGVRAVLLNSAARGGSRAALAPPLRDDPVAYAGPGGVVVRNRQALPPAFVAYRWRRSPSQNASLFEMAAGTPRQARDDPVIETSAAPPPGPVPAATVARVVSRSDTAVTLAVRAWAPGRLVLLDTYYPGWHAEVDGRATPIQPADGAFRAVAVGPGRHTVRFFYRPASVIAGGAVSVAALAALAACLLLGRRRRRVAHARATAGERSVPTHVP